MNVDREMWARSILEEPFQAQIIGEMKRTGWTVAHFRTVRIQRRNGQVYYATPVQADGAGFLDLLALRPPRQLVVEVKRHNGKVESEQGRWLALWRSMPGVEVYVWRPLDWDQIVEVLA